ncbi:hypothetical protein CATMIT_00863, partial [Catenibacterium mitsuokai DSM 15897]
VVEHGAGAEGAAVGADLVVDHVELAVGGERMGVVAVQRADHHRPGALRLAHALQLALGQIEQHVDGMHLGQGDQRGAGVEHVADIDAAQAGDAGNRRGNAGVLQLHLGRAHRRIVGGDRAFELGDLVALGVQVGLGHVLAVLRRVGALVVGARGRQLRLVLALGRGGLVVAGLRGARVDPRQQVA